MYINCRRLVGVKLFHIKQKQSLSLVRFRCSNMKLTRELFHIKQNQTLLLFSVAVPSLFHICIMKKISMVLQWLICT